MRTSTRKPTPALAIKYYSETNLRPYDVHRSQIYHEDELINHRVSWFTSAQAFFFLVYAQEHVARSVSLLMLVIGPVICLLALISILAAALKMWSCEKRLRDTFRESAIHFPPLAKFDAIHLSGMAAPILIPVTLLLGWLHLILVEHGNGSREFDVMMLAIVVTAIFLGWLSIAARRRLLESE